MSEIEKFYADKSVFLTGGTGFLGKILIEKLLRSCPRLKKIYVLIRPNSANCSQKRLDDLFSCEVFNFLKETQPFLLDKVEPISGNITYPNLGINYDCLTRLKREVDIVLHSAATIRFDEPLKKALEINLCGTEGVLKFCNQLNNLISFVHISTAYCNTIKDDIEEKVYEHNISVENILSANRWMDAELLESLSEKLYCGRPSSYHYTKALAESLVLHNAQNLNKVNRNYKSAIVRPSIVTPTLNEPLKGWTNNYYGPTGYLVVCGKGVLRSMIVHKDKICDIVPVDIVANTAITAAYYITKQGTETELTSSTIDNQVLDEKTDCKQQTNGDLSDKDVKVKSQKQVNEKFYLNGKFSSDEEDFKDSLDEPNSLNGFKKNEKLTNGHLSNGKSSNGNLMNGKLSNGHSTNGKLTNGDLANDEKSVKLSNGKLTNGGSIVSNGLTNGSTNGLTNGLTNGKSNHSASESEEEQLHTKHRSSSSSLINKKLQNDKFQSTISQQLTVFNCVSGTSNPISWGEIHSLCEPFLLKYPSIELFRYPGALLHSNKVLHQIILQLEHNIPAMLIDFVFKLLGHKPILTPVYDKVHRSIEALEHFTTNQWTWKTDNFEKLIQSQNEIDKDKFFIDIQRLNWKSYMESYILGVRYYLLREDPSTIPNARKKLNRLYYLTQIVKIGIAGGIMMSMHQAITKYPTFKKYLLWVSSKRAELK